MRDIDVWFQPTLPLRGATPEGGRAVPHLPRVSTHAPLAGSDEGQIAPSQPDLVSTHAPLAGSDRQAPWCTCAGAGFNPRSPCGERRPPAAGVASLPMSFNPRSPCGERPRVRARTRVSHGFNPRSPCGERPRRRPCGCGTGCFNPRSPCGERRHRVPSAMVGDPVSTHAPLAGSDALLGACHGGDIAVSTHAPLAGSDGEARRLPWTSWVSTHAPLAGSDAPHQRGPDRVRVSTHAPISSQMYDPSGFNPRSPCGERHPHDFVRPDVRLVSTHAPLAGSDSWPRGSGRAARGFNPRSPCGERLPVGSVVWGSNSFNPRSPCGERPAMPAPMPAT